MGYDIISSKEINEAGGVDLFLEKHLERTYPGNYISSKAKILAKDKNSDGRFYIIERETTYPDKVDKSTLVMIAVTESRGGGTAIRWLTEMEEPYRYPPVRFIKEVEKYIPVPPNAGAVKWRTKSLNRESDMGY